MNRTKIEWCDYTWSPITGCSRRCPYCYAWAMSKRLKGRFGYPADDPFRVTFHPNRLTDPRDILRAIRIFVCSMGEIYDPACRLRWITAIYAEMRRNPQHTFISLTQQADTMRRVSWQFPGNLWQGVTVTKQDQCDRIDLLADTDAAVKLVSFEPLLEPVDTPLKGIDWIIIGAKTGILKFQPPTPWVDTLIANARDHGCAVFLKDNLDWSERLQEFPGEVNRE